MGFSLQTTTVHQQYDEYHSRLRIYTVYSSIKRRLLFYNELYILCNLIRFLTFLLGTYIPTYVTKKSMDWFLYENALPKGSHVFKCLA